MGSGNRKPVFLLGFMGSGKTTVGQKLAQRVGWRFVDLDETIEENLHAAISEIFASRGESFFREVEQETLERLLIETEGSPACVLALGGGTFVQPQNVLLVRSHGGATIWLRCPPEQLLFRCAMMNNRPLFRDEASFHRLYREREPYYQTADFTVDTGDVAPDRVVDRIIALGLF